MGHHKPKGGPFGIIAEFDHPQTLLDAANKALDAGYSRMDAFTPYPVHGLAEAIGFNEAKVPWIVFLGGFTGAAGGMGLQWWVSTQAYPLNIGGRPLFSWPAFIPPAFETTILLASFGAVFGMILLNRLPQPHHPVFEAPNFERASQDRFFLLIEARDPAYREDEVMSLLQGTKALNVSLINEKEEQDW
jgi:hypothetical protein